MSAPPTLCGTGVPQLGVISFPRYKQCIYILRMMALILGAISLSRITHDNNIVVQMEGDEEPENV